MDKPRVILLGKLPPPFIGPAIATQILLNSELLSQFELYHFDTTLNKEVGEMGRFGWGKLRRSWSGYRRLFQMAKSTSAQLALVPISQTTMGFFKDSLYILALRRAGVPVLIQLRGSQFKTWVQNASPQTRWWVRSVLRKTEGVIVLGEKLRHLFEDFFPSERIHVSPNGADFPELEDNSRQSSVELNALYLSNYLPGKSFDTVLKAITQLKEDSVKLTAHGAWDDREFESRCRELIRKEQLKNVIIGDSVSGDAKWKALKQADVFVFVPRHPEGHPWAIVEAMAAGLPVISTDRGAITESVIDGKNGFIVPAENPDALAEKLRFFAQNPEAVHQMGVESRRLYEQHFTQSKMAARYAAIFRKVMASCAE